MHKFLNGVVHDPFSVNILLGNNQFLLVHNFLDFLLDNALNGFLDHSFMDDFLFDNVLDWYLDDHFVRNLHNPFPDDWSLNHNFKVSVDSFSPDIRVVFTDPDIPVVLHIAGIHFMTASASPVDNRLISSLIDDSLISFVLSHVGAPHFLVSVDLPDFSDSVRPPHFLDTQSFNLSSVKFIFFIQQMANSFMFSPHTLVLTQVTSPILVVMFLEANQVFLSLMVFMLL